MADRNQRSRNPLTAAGRPPYHKSMRVLRISLLAVAASLAAAGCEDAAKSSVRASTPATSLRAVPDPPAPQQAKPAANALPPLPLWARAPQAPVLLFSQKTDRKAQLIAQVEEKFSSGEQNFK